MDLANGQLVFVQLSIRLSLPAKWQEMKDNDIIPELMVEKSVLMHAALIPIDLNYS